MRSMRERLGEVAGPPAGGVPTAPSSLKDGLDYYDRLHRPLAPSAPARDPVPVEKVLPGCSRVETPYGAALVGGQRMPVTARHGGIALCDVLDADASLLAPLLRDERLADFDARRALFLDIEATGLSHGAGTISFLVGMLCHVRHEDFEGFEISQVFIEDPSNEMAGLHVVAEALREHPFLVSFNGKSYDLSVLQTRLAIHRFRSSGDAPLKLTPHLDLLHVSRRLWKDVLPSCRLRAIEEAHLGLRRVDDVPGELVPSLYFHYLATGDASVLAPVFSHNRDDVLSLVTLAGRVMRSLSAQPGDLDAYEALAVARMALRARMPERACALAEAALDCLPKDAREEAVRIAAVARRRLAREKL